MRRATNVQELLELLHIDVIATEIEAKHDMIRESYQVPKYVADDYWDFLAIVLHYYQYHYASWMNAPIEMPPDMAYSEVRQILASTPHPDARLTKIRGYLEDNGGYIQSIKNALRGRHGGLVGVIDAIAESMKMEAVKQYVTAVFLEAVDPLDFETKVRFMEEYVNRYGNVILEGEETVSIAELATHLEVVIESHAKLVNEFRRTLQ